MDELENAILDRLFELREAAIDAGRPPNQSMAVLKSEIDFHSQTYDVEDVSRAFNLLANRRLINIVHPGQPNERVSTEQAFVNITDDGVQTRWPH